MDVTPMDRDPGVGRRGGNLGTLVEEPGGYGEEGEEGLYEYDQ